MTKRILIRVSDLQKAENEKKALKYMNFEKLLNDFKNLKPLQKWL
jgi:hypothetical protein